MKTLVYYLPQYRDQAENLRDNYISHHHGEVDLISVTIQDDIEYAREMKYDEAIFIENNTEVIIHDIESGFTKRCPVSDVYYSEK